MKRFIATIAFTSSLIVHCCAQKFYSVTHFNSTTNVNNIPITVSGTGVNASRLTSGPDYDQCGTGSILTPYSLANSVSNVASSILFSFAVPARRVSMRFASLQISDTSRFYINGSKYTITSSNISNITGFCTNTNGIASSGDYVGLVYCPGSPGGVTGGPLTGKIDIDYGGALDSIRIFGANKCGGFTFDFAFAGDTLPYIVPPFKDTVFCPGDSLRVACGSTDTGKSGNVFTVQLSDASGSFSSPVNIGSKTGTTVDTIRCLIPQSQAAGTGYRIRIVSSSPARTSRDDLNNIRIKPSTLGFSSSSNTPVCETDTIRLNATTTSSGVTWNWTGPLSYSSTNPTNKFGQVTSSMAGKYVVKATLTSSGCSLVDTQNIVVNPLPAKPIAGSNTPVCYGTTLNLTASTLTSGVAWSWNGPNSFTGTSQNPNKTGVIVADGGSYIVAAILNGCSRKDTTNVVVANSVPSPIASSNSPLCIGSDIFLTASTVAGASSYSWTGPSGFISTSQNPMIPSGQSVNGGIYSVTATLNGCPSVADTTTVQLIQGPIIIAFANPRDSICIGNPVSLSAIPVNAVAGATYQWVKNSVNAGGTSTNLSYLPGAVADGDTFMIVLTPASGDICTTPVNSNRVVVHVLPYLTPGATISTDTNINWPGVLVSFHGTATNAGLFPFYQWQLNGIDIQGATDSIWGTTALQDLDSVCVEITSSYVCPSPPRVKACAEVRIATGIKATAHSAIKIFPDPFNDQLSISGAELRTKIQLLDIVGRVLLKTTADRNNVVVNTATLKPGTYILLLTNKDGLRNSYSVVKDH